MKRIILVLLVMLAASSISQAAGSHPASGHSTDPREIERYRHAQYTPSNWSFGDVQFFGPAANVPADDLSDAEKYILGGVTSSSLADGGPLGPWSMSIFTVAYKYYMKHGVMPTTINEGLLRQEYGDRFNFDPAYINIYRNPITGEWPRVDAQTFSPGDAYIHALDAAEIQQLTKVSGYYRKVLNDKKAMDPRTNKMGDASIVVPPFYVRIYGEHKPLIEMIQLAYTVN